VGVSPRFHLIITTVDNNIIADQPSLRSVGYALILTPVIVASGRYRDLSKTPVEYSSMDMAHSLH
jgi:hypothetical protein